MYQDHKEKVANWNKLYFILSFQGKKERLILWSLKLGGGGEEGKCWKGMREITGIPKHMKTKLK